jgi:glycerol-3-phosphate O-acyltransferase
MHQIVNIFIETEKRNKSILVLDYYRNQVLHLFTAEGIIACAMSAAVLTEVTLSIT